MSRAVFPPALSLDAVPLSALDIGVWEDLPAANEVRGDAVMARIFGLSEVEAARSITWEQLRAIFHPDDLALDTAERRSVRENGGLFEWMHRIVPRPGIVRWVLARGCFLHETDGRIRGRGIVIDVTEIVLEGTPDEGARFASVRDGAGSALQVTADHAIKLVRAVEGLDRAKAGRIEPFLKPLLYEIGRQIAATIADDPIELAGLTPREG